MKGGKPILKEHIYTLNISDEHPNSITLPYVFSITPPITSLSFGIRHIASEEVKFIIPLLAKLLSESILPKNFTASINYYSCIHTKPNNYFRTINRHFYNWL